MVVTVESVGTAVTVPLTLGKGTTVTVLAGAGMMVLVSGGHGTSVVYVLVTRTGAGVDTLMVQGQARSWSVLGEFWLWGGCGRGNLRRVMVVSEVTV